MSTKLKVLGLGLLAIMATSAFAVMNASATPSGHFVSAANHTIIFGSENATHQVKFSVEGGNTIECKKVEYHGTTETATVTEITIKPTYAECQTTGGAANSIPVTVNDCDYVFSSQGTRIHGTVTVNCPVGKAIEIHHPNCTITVGTQHALGGGIAYDNTHPDLTATVTVSGIVVEYHGGACIFLGTTHTATMTGAATIQGRDTAGNPVTISST
ncbi:MAG TPA: hypothetical protein VGB06_06725 [Solirubrobacterales bacterium]|jgi:hypothetical protein